MFVSHFDMAAPPLLEAAPGHSLLAKAAVPSTPYYMTKNKTKIYSLTVLEARSLGDLGF